MNNNELNTVYQGNQVTLYKLYQLDKEGNKKVYQESQSLDSLCLKDIRAAWPADNKILFMDSVRKFETRVNLIIKDLGIINSNWSEMSYFSTETVQDCSPQTLRLVAENYILLTRNRINKLLLNNITDSYDGFSEAVPVVSANCDHLKPGDNFHAQVYITYNNHYSPYEVVVSNCTFNGNPVKLPVEVFTDNGNCSINFKPGKKGHYVLRGYLRMGDFKNNRMYFSKDFVVE